MTFIIRALSGRALLLGATTAALVSGSRPYARGEQRPAPVEVLQQVGLSGDEIAAVERGDAVARLIETDRRQVAVAGAVRIRGRREALVERLRTIDFLERSSALMGAGVLTNPYGPDDLNAVPFEPYDLDLRACRPGDCRVRLSDADIMRFQRDVKWNSPAWQEESASIWREVLASYVAGYSRHGAKALPVFANKEERVAVADEQALLLTETAFIRYLAPGLLAHLRDPAGRPLPGSVGFVYWSKEDFEIRPVLRITYQAIYSPEPSSNQPERPIVIGSTQLYAAHYLDAAVMFLIALQPPPADADKGFYLIAVSRARTRSLSGWLRRIPRATVQKRSRHNLEKVLWSAKSSVEGQSASLAR